MLAPPWAWPWRNGPDRPVPWIGGNPGAGDAKPSGSASGSATGTQSTSNRWPWEAAPRSALSWPTTRSISRFGCEVRQTAHVRAGT